MSWTHNIHATIKLQQSGTHLAVIFPMALANTLRLRVAKPYIEFVQSTDADKHRII